MDTKYIRQYWAKVIRESLVDSWKESPAKKALSYTIPFLVMLVGVAGLGFLTGWIPLPFFLDRLGELQAGMYALCGSLAALLVLFLLTIYRKPAELHKEQDNDKDKLQIQIQELKNKLEIREIDANIEIEEFLQDESMPQYLSLKIINQENVDLIRCYGTLVSVELVSTVSKELKDSINPNNMLLSWGAGSPDGYVTIHKNKGARVLNIAKAIKGYLVFLFHEWESKTDMDGIYHLVVKVDGNIGDLSKSFKSIIYDGYFKVEILPIPPSVLLRPLDQPNVNVRFLKAQEVYIRE